MTPPSPANRPPRPARRMAALVLGLLGAGLLAALLWPAAAGPDARPAARAPAPVVAAAPAPPPSAAPAPATAPPLLDAGQWAQLQAALADHPQRDAELARILGLLDYQRAVRRFAAMRHAGADASALQALASRLDAELVQRLARRELSGPEATQLKTALLEVLQPDPALRAPALADWRAARLAADPPASDPRDAAFLQAQQALVARWRTQAPPGSPPDGLLAALEELRQRSYPSNNP